MFPPDIKIDSSLHKPGIKHFAYLGYYVYYVLGDVYITDLEGHIIDAYKANRTIEEFTEAKMKINAFRDGAILLHGITSEAEEQEAQGKAPVPKGWQLVQQGKHKLVKNEVYHD